MQGLAQAKLPDDPISNLADYEHESFGIRSPLKLSAEDIERWITSLALSGESCDKNGWPTNMEGSVEHAVALQWVGDKARVGGIIGGAFWKWAEKMAYIEAKYNSHS